MTPYLLVGPVVQNVVQYWSKMPERQLWALIPIDTDRKLLILRDPNLNKAL